MQSPFGVGTSSVRRGKLKLTPRLNALASLWDMLQLVLFGPPTPPHRVTFSQPGSINEVRNLFGNLRYTLRQFRQSPVFTTAAIFTLALGIGGTTAIFTLIDAVMLRSLPVSNPALLYRIGDGDDCCVEIGPQDRWGMFSYALYQRLKTEAPELADVAAFQAGGGRLSVRREGPDLAAKPLRAEYVTGNYFSTRGVSAFGGGLFRADDDTPAATPVVVLSHH